jgi:hypothetical protein
MAAVALGKPSAKWIRSRHDTSRSLAMLDRVQNAFASAREVTA